ncbi:MAG: ATP-binding cassette domain-containing protein [Planctomycetales bacterium]|nr:ATP-binding cassette domain-containing protein [Planctomycetales bacterium]
MWAVETQGLSKSYGHIHSLIDCDLQIAGGCVFGLLGPNGAGKTTLLRTLLGFLHPTRGSGSIAGFDILRDNLRARRQVTYLPGDARLMRSMRGDRLLKWFSGLHPYGSWDAAQVVAQQLELELTRHVMFMSTGMRQKLALTIVLSCQAPVVMLDEPTANLDPNVRQTVLRLIREVRSQGRTVIVSSHIFDDIDETCDHVAILKSGELVGQVNMADLQHVHWVSGRVASESSRSPQQWQELMNRQPLLVSHHLHRSAAHSEQIELQLKGEPQQWFRWLSELQLTNMRIQRGGIRAIYERYHHAT